MYVPVETMLRYFIIHYSGHIFWLVLYTSHPMVAIADLAVCGGCFALSLSCGCIEPFLWLQIGCFLEVQRACCVIADLYGVP